MIRAVVPSNLPKKNLFVLFWGFQSVFVLFFLEATELSAKTALGGVQAGGKSPATRDRRGPDDLEPDIDGVKLLCGGIEHDVTPQQTLIHLLHHVEAERVLGIRGCQEAHKTEVMGTLEIALKAEVSGMVGHARGLCLCKCASVPRQNIHDGVPVELLFGSTTAGDSVNSGRHVVCCNVLYWRKGEKEIRVFSQSILLSN